MKLSYLGRLNHLFSSGVLLSVGNVVMDGGTEQKHVLLDDSDVNA